MLGPEHGGRGHDLIARLYGGDNHPVDREEPYDAEQQGEDSGAGAARDLAGVGSAAGRCRLRCAMRYGPWILNTFHKDDPLFQGFANISVPVAISGVGYGSATPFPTVDIDNRLASRKLTEHMLGRGYRRIAYIIGPSYLPTPTPACPQLTTEVVAR